MGGVLARGRRRAGISPVLSAAITSAIILAAGIALYLIIMSFSGTLATNYQRSIDRSVAKYQLALSADYVKLLSNGRVKVWIRNYGETAAVIVDAYAYLPDSAPSRGLSFSTNVTVPRGGVEDIVISCEGCGNDLHGKEIVIKVFAIPERLYDPEKPETYAQFGRYFAFRVEVPPI